MKLFLYFNLQGGTFLLDVSDNREDFGFDEWMAEQLCENFPNLSKYSSKLDPGFLLQPTIIDVDGKKIIHVFVPIYDRMKYILDVILSQKNINVGELSTHLQASEKTIKRDLAYLNIKK